MNFNHKKTVIAAGIAALVSFSASAEDQVRMVLESKANKMPSIKAQLETLGVEINRQLPSMDSFAITLDRDKLADVASLDGVNAFYPDAPRELMSEGGGEIIPYGLPMVQGDQVSYQGGQKVCIIDSGYTLGHPDLPVNGVNGAEDGGAGPWYQDPFGHGTHVAGTIASLKNNSGSVGVISDESLELHIVRVFNYRGDYAYASDIAGAIEECQESGANIVSMSLGGSFSSPLEQRAIDRMARDGMLMIAAAGNSANAQHSYPASYDSVVSVAAIDDHKRHAPFSQRTTQVELAAPGVNVFSTLPLDRGARYNPTMMVTQGDVIFQGFGMNSFTNELPMGTVSGKLVSCGIGDESCGDMTGKICLMERGGFHPPEVEGGLPTPITFEDKINQCAEDGGVGAIVRTNTTSPIPGTVDNISIIAGTVSHKQGLTLLDNIGEDTTITVHQYPDHGFMSGTSMATPHVSGVAAVVWSNFPHCTASGIRQALRASAEDLGKAGYDYKYGWGLVQAKDAIDYIATNGCDTHSGKIYGGDGSPR
ncbi:Subtilisin DY [Microbulbifer aggregans]|uniref:Subtilisin DY n=1 Tax=Microbulbifer aggregans TaxID=1769779 RepID=A0A1C9W4S6_9GAMM|nr:S8 family serine peptidase [Microbulbifer aggregans]AOS96158.1 Subtilisin DY [Microbulbifer aggregans]